MAPFLFYCCRRGTRWRPGRPRSTDPTAQCNRSLPDLPPISETVPGVVIANWYSMFFPKGTSPAIVDKLSVLIKKALSDKEIDEFYGREGLVPLGGKPPN